MPAFTCYAMESSPPLFARTACCRAIHANFKISRTGLFLFLGRQNHDHLTAFHLGPLLYLTVRLQVQLQALQHAHADILVSHLATAETQRDLGFVALIQELDEITQLD